jgi:hypothetical protein
MTEIRRADPAARRRAVLLVVLGALVGSLLIAGSSDTARPYVSGSSSARAIGASIQANVFAVGCCAVRPTDNLSHLSLVAWRQGLASGGVSAPGYRVNRDTRVILGIAR